MAELTVGAQEGAQEEKGQEKARVKIGQKAVKDEGVSGHSEIDAKLLELEEAAERLRELEEAYKSKLKSLDKLGNIEEAIESLEKKRMALDEAVVKNVVASEASGSGGIFKGKDESWEEFAARDTMDTEVSFFAHRDSYQIISETRNGIPSSPPYGKPIVFKNIIRKPVQSRTKGMVVHAVCRYSTRSRSTVEWLKQSPRFGVEFHLSPNTDKRKAGLVDEIASIMRRLQNKGREELNSLARDKGVRISESIDEVRREIAEKMAWEKINSINELAAKAALESSELAGSRQ